MDPSKQRPPIGELAEVTVKLEPLPVAPIVASAAIKTLDGRTGVWKMNGEEIVFTPITLGRSDLDGYIQITKGLEPGDKVVLYSEKMLTMRSRIHIVDRIPGWAP